MPDQGEDSSPIRTSRWPDSTLVFIGREKARAVHELPFDLPDEGPVPYALPPLENLGIWHGASIYKKEKE